MFIYTYIVGCLYIKLGLLGVLMLALSPELIAGEVIWDTKKSNANFSVLKSALLRY